MTIKQRLELEEVLAGWPPRTVVMEMIEASSSQDAQRHRDAIKAVLDAVLSKGSLLVTDDGKALARCATELSVSH